VAKRIGGPRKIRVLAEARGCEVLRVGGGCALVDGYSRAVLTEGTLASIARLLADDEHPFWAGDPDVALTPRDTWVRLNDPDLKLS
jgi:hypothetical protein